MRCQPELELVRKKFVVDAGAAFAQLPADTRLVISLALVDGLSYEEISDIMSCPVGTVRSRLNRGRQRLRELLANYSDDPTTNESNGIGFMQYGNRPIH
ncbi:MAG: sigma factor-like helix-turn-helix DNA-binding protein [Burkholderiaceae bacterium]